jgi:hypothetical protein
VPGRAHLKAVHRAGALLAVGLAALLTGCTSADEVPGVQLPRAQAAACDAFVADLPSTLDGLSTREDSASGAPRRAWGDPAVEVSCGVEQPEELDRTASCEEVEGIGWFLSPQSAYDDPAADVALTTIGVRPRVRLDVPGEQRPPADFLAVLSPLVREHLRVVRACA